MGPESIGPVAEGAGAGVADGDAAGVGAGDGAADGAGEAGGSTAEGPGDDPVFAGTDAGGELAGGRSSLVQLHNTNATPITTEICSGSFMVPPLPGSLRGAYRKVNIWAPQ